MQNAEGPISAVFVSPRRYVQGRGALSKLGDELGRLEAHRPLILRDTVVAELLGDALARIEGAFVVDFRGQCSPEEIERVASLAHEEGVDAVAGVGGGKALDVAKAVAYPEKMPLVIVPTVASTDSPTSSLAVIYSEEGDYQGTRFYGRNPDCVLVDTEMVARAPVRFLVAGMGDALSTYVEAEAAVRTGANTLSGGTPTEAALAITRLCHDLVMKHGMAARAAVERDAVTPAVEKVVEANTLLSGLGFESGGVSAAHAFHNGLTVLPETHHCMHGEKVAFGIVCQLMLEGRPDEEADEVVDFCLKVGLPVTLADLGLANVSRDDLEKAAKRASEPGELIHNEPFEVRPGMVLDAMLTADAFAHRRRAILEHEMPLPTVLTG